MAVHGANICYLEKRLNVLLQKLGETYPNFSPDAIFLEYAVNDYEGQDDRIQLFFIEDVFFDGFRDIATCTEGIVRGLLERYPDLMLMFLEFKTALEKRQTAQFLHMAVAQHYDVPVISYADAILQPLYRQVAQLHPKSISFDPKQTAKVLIERPFGCTADAKCPPKNLVTMECRPLCKLFKGSQAPDCLNLPPNHVPCFTPLFLADEVHPSGLGHRLAADLIVHAIATEAERKCKGEVITVDYMPPTGLMTSPAVARARAQFVMVNETQMVAPRNIPDLISSQHTNSWRLYAEKYDKFGWISTTNTPGENITFPIRLPPRSCYAIFLGVLRSYDQMGKYRVTITDHSQHTETSKVLDGQWSAHISVWSEDMVSSDDPRHADCTGDCSLTVTTMPPVPGRSGNKVKILTLSVRECVKR